MRMHAVSPMPSKSDMAFLPGSTVFVMSMRKQVFPKRFDAGRVCGKREEKENCNFFAAKVKNYNKEV